MSKAPFVLLINPWITDFAAHDLWTKPMGLLVLASLLRDGGCGVALIDCLDRRDPFTNSHPETLPGRDKEFGTGKYPRMRLPKPGPYSDFPRYFYRHGIHPESLSRKFLEIESSGPDLDHVEHDLLVSRSLGNGPNCARNFSRHAGVAWRHIRQALSRPCSKGIAGRTWSLRRTYRICRK